MEPDPGEKLAIANRNWDHCDRDRNCSCRQHHEGIGSPRVFGCYSFPGLGPEWALGPRHTPSGHPRYAGHAVYCAGHPGRATPMNRAGKKDAHFRRETGAYRRGLWGDQSQHSGAITRTDRPRIAAQPNASHGARPLTVGAQTPDEVERNQVIIFGKQSMRCANATLVWMFYEDAGQLRRPQWIETDCCSAAVLVLSLAYMLGGGVIS